MVCKKCVKLYKQWLKSKHSSFFQEIHRVIMRNLSLVMNLQCKHNYFYTLVTPNESDQRERKQRRNEGNVATPIILQSWQNKANSAGKIHKFNTNIRFNPQPSIHLLVSKTSWRCFEDMSWKTNWRCLHCNYLSLTKAFSRRSQDVLEMSSRHLAIWKFFTLRTSLKPLPRHVLETWNSKI